MIDSRELADPEMQVERLLASVPQEA